MIMMRFNHENSNFLVTQNWLQAKCPGFIEKNQWRANFPDLNHRLMLEKYHKPQLKPETTDELKVDCRPSGKSCHKNTSTRRWQTSPSAWLPA